MDLTAWALYLFITGAILGAVFLHYRLREPAGTGRGFLAVLRGLAVAGVVLLLFNPRLPAGRADAPRVLAVVDASASMGMPADPGSAWNAALAAVDSLAPDRVLLTGDPGLRERAPEDTAGALHSHLGPAVRAALESGAGRVVVFTDGAVEDPGGVRSVMETGRGAALRVVGGTRRFNAGLTELLAPRWAEVGRELAVTVSVAAMGSGAPDSVVVALRHRDRELARSRLPTPPEGREASAVLRYTPREGEDRPVRLDVVLLDGGTMEDDDVRSVYVDIQDIPAGVALVSLAPGQEPRFLLPVLARATGLPVRGWASVAPGRWVRIGEGVDAGRVEGQDAPATALAGADVVVVHGLTDAAPGWVEAAVATADWVLVFPGDDAPGLPFDPGPARVADWYVVDAVPASPVAALLAGAATEGLPPLRALRTASEGDFWAPMRARAGRRGEDHPVLVAGEVDGRRVAVAMGEGYWRWAFAGPEGRAFYDRFWSGVAGWLAEVDDVGAGGGIEPVERVVGRGQALEWRVPGDVDSVVVRLEPSAGGETVETVAVVDGIARLPGVGPGHYGYTVRPVPGTGVGMGEITVESYSAEWTRPVRMASMGEAGEATRPVRRTPLRSMPWGYVVVLVLLSVEWVLRRRWGLR